MTPWFTTTRTLFESVFLYFYIEGDVRCPATEGDGRQCCHRNHACDNQLKSVKFAEEEDFTTDCSVLLSGSGSLCPFFTAKILRLLYNDLFSSSFSIKCFIVPFILHIASLRFSSFISFSYMAPLVTSAPLIIFRNPHLSFFRFLIRDSSVSPFFALFCFRFISLRFFSFVKISPRPFLSCLRLFVLFCCESFPNVSLVCQFCMRRCRRRTGNTASTSSNGTVCTTPICFLMLLLLFCLCLCLFSFLNFHILLCVCSCCC